MKFIGDIHGNFHYYFSVIKKITDTFTIQIGDFGFGMGEPDEPKSIEGNHYFIRGNHDSPEVCRNHPNYLGDYGYMMGVDVFYVSGAHSPDKLSRHEGNNVWSEEELPYSVLNNEMIPLYLKFRPKIVVSHDAPISVITQMFPMRNIAISRTNQALQSMFEEHQPDLWVFGHHHRSKQMKIGRTLFVCVGTGDVFNYEETKEG